MKNNEIIIIGGGLAGLTAAIHLSKIGFKVIVFEKNEFPKHKVCGEYISNEIMPYFEWLDLKIQDLKPTKITDFQFSTVDGSLINKELPLGGFGISRYALDDYLYKKAIANGCEILKENVENIVFDNNRFTITTSENNIYIAEIVIGAYGKRSNIDQKLNRNFTNKKSPWLAVKAHYTGNFRNNLVGLYNFKGGYCGVSKVENDTINICYLADYESFKKYKNIEEYQKEVVFKNPVLKKIVEESTMVFDKPITISQINFSSKKSVEDHILMIGDTAGLIHPLCGNGMAMAIHSAKIVSELIEHFYTNTIKSRAELEEKYSAEWNLNFKKRIQFGRYISLIFQKHRLSQVLMRILVLFPFLVSIIIRQTHGKPLV
ncbi:MAG: NAD(P)/FAD-dependent oxidoreductase [Bacteroidota bacterium]